MFVIIKMMVFSYLLNKNVYLCGLIGFIKLTDWKYEKTFSALGDLLVGLSGGVCSEI